MRSSQRNGAKRKKRGWMHVKNKKQQNKKNMERAPNNPNNKVNSMAIQDNRKRVGGKCERLQRPMATAVNPPPQSRHTSLDKLTGFGG